MRKLSTGNVVVPYKVDEAGHTRDAMTKTLYALLFEWIIKQINKTLEVRLMLLVHATCFVCLCVDVSRVCTNGARTLCLVGTSVVWLTVCSPYRTTRVIR